MSVVGGRGAHLICSKCCSRACSVWEIRTFGTRAEGGLAVGLLLGLGSFALSESAGTSIRYSSLEQITLV